MQPRTNRLALVLFAVYLVIYSGFVFLNAFAPATMEVMPLAGVNLAILYGFALIIIAFVLALLYGWLAMGSASPTAHDVGSTQKMAAPHDGVSTSDSGATGRVEEHP